MPVGVYLDPRRSSTTLKSAESGWMIKRINSRPEQRLHKPTFLAENELSEDGVGPG